MPFGLFRRSANRRVIDRLHGDIVAAVRQPLLYEAYGIADTFEGRFEVLALLSTLLVRRLAGLPAPGPDMAQEVTDALFTGLDGSLREMGVGDLTVPKRMKKLAEGFLGRRQAYDEGLRTGDDAILAAALSRNVYGGRVAPDSIEVLALTRYVGAVSRSLDGLTVESVRTDGAAFPLAGAAKQEVP